MRISSSSQCSHQLVHHRDLWDYCIGNYRNCVNENKNWILKKKKRGTIMFQEKAPEFRFAWQWHFTKVTKRFLRLYHYSPLKALTSLIFHIFVLRTRALSSQASATSKKIRSSCFLGRLQPSVARWFFTVGTGGQRRSALTRREPIM